MAAAVGQAKPVHCRWHAAISSMEKRVVCSHGRYEMGACVAQTCTRRVTPPQEQPAKPDYLSTRSQRYSTLTVTGASITPDGHWRFEQARVTSRPSKHTARRWSGDAEDCQRSGAWTLARFLEATALRTVDQDGCSGRARKHLHRRQCCDTKFTHGSVRSPSGIDEISTAVDPNEWDEGCTELRATLSIKQNRSVGHSKPEPPPRARVSATSLARHIWPAATYSPQISARAGTLISAEISVCLAETCGAGLCSERPSWATANGDAADAAQIVTRHILCHGKPIPRPFRSLPRRRRIPVGGGRPRLQTRTRTTTRTTLTVVVRDQDEADDD